MKIFAILGGIILTSTTLALGYASVTPNIPVRTDSVVELSTFEPNLNEVAVQTPDFAMLNKYKLEFSQLIDERIAANTKVNAVNLEHFEKTPLNLALESEGTIVQFKHYVASPHNIFVWFDVILPEGELFYKEHYSPSNWNAPFGSTDGTSHNFLVVNDEQVELKNYSTEVYWLNEENSSSNTGSFLIEFCFDSPLQESTVFTMSWDGFYGSTSYSSLEDRFIVDDNPQIISGQWECSIPLSDEIMVKEYTIGTELEYARVGNGDVVMDSMTVSPMTLGFNLSYDKEIGSGFFLTSPFEEILQDAVVVHYEDGSHDFAFWGITGHDMFNGTLNYSAKMTTPKNLEVTAVTFMGQEFLLSDYS